jgi:hypothetical protein
MARREIEFQKNSRNDFTGAAFNLMAQFRKPMKRWAIYTVLLYVLALVLLTLPVDLIAFGNWGKKQQQCRTS